MTVNHKVFGTGTLVSQDAKTVTVDFNGKVKSLIIKYANLTLEDGTLLSEPKKVKATKKQLPKVDYSKYSDAELIQMHSNLLSDLVDAKVEARKDGKTGTR